MKKIVSLIFLSFILFTNLFAQNNEIKFSGWKQAETEHFVFVYEEASREATEEFIKIADEAWIKVAKIYSIPKEKIRIYVTGRTNTVNAYTFTFPVEIMMFTNPCTLSDFPHRGNWAELFFTHELIHAANFSFEDKSKVPSMLVGPFATALDYLFIDSWALEGLTTVLETELTEGGRGISPYFELDYKSLTLDNNFLSYNEIGAETRPPRGQNYVMGYLLCRSIADRFGLQALADIERNRKYLGSWGESVKLVTGYTPRELFSDVQISLAKKYADERKIPEGITISPRKNNTSYYNPAIVFDDGTFISLRSATGEDTAVVRFDPGKRDGSNHLADTKPEKDLNSVYKETVLFTGNFFDENAVTADENETVYAVLAENRLDRFPGNEVEAVLYKWTKEDGLKKLTTGTSLFQPSVSRDGKVLVAIQQKGMCYRLVKVDTQTGEVTVLLQDKNLQIMQPKLNADGSKVAFLCVDAHRARVAVADMNNPENYEFVANDGEKIYDPANPNWTKEGAITFTCNFRGRLEVCQTEKTEEGWVSTPVVSDPVGVLWAYKNDVGVIYSSVASTGNVIKIKPAEEWGVVPDFDGPSPAGEKICFGQLQNDYPDFVPYDVPSNKEITEEELKEIENHKSEDGPIPVKGKVVKHRKPENITKANEAEKTITAIQNEKKFISVPKPVLYLPFVDFIYDEDTKEIYFEPAFSVVTMFPRTQMDLGFMELNLCCVPQLNNVEGSLDIVLQTGPMELMAFAGRQLLLNETNGVKKFVENNYAILGYTQSLYHRVQHRNDKDLLVLGCLSGQYIRIADKPCGFTGNFKEYPYLNGKLGTEFYWTKEGIKKNDFTMDTSLFALINYDFTENHCNLGGEGEFSVKYRNNGIKYGAVVKARYAPFGENSIPMCSCLSYGGNEVDCSIPGRIVPRIQIGIPLDNSGVFSFNTFSEFMFSFGPDMTFTNQDFGQIGMEFVDEIDKLEVAGGIVTEISKDMFSETILDKINLYWRIKYNWLRR